MSFGLIPRPRPAVRLAWALTLAVLCLAQEPKAAASACAGCHDDQLKKFGSSVHASLGCTGCHPDHEKQPPVLPCLSCRRGVHHPGRCDSRPELANSDVKTL